MSYIPVSDPPPPDDFHTWARPVSPPCTRCDCCSAQLCQTARQRKLPCVVVGDQGPGVMDLSNCPCATGGGRAGGFTCPRCGRTSYHPEDLRHGYCGACHAFTGQEGRAL